MLRKLQKQAWFKILFGISIAVGLYLRLQYIGRDFWHDEAFQWIYSQKPVLFIIQSNDVHPPLFNLFAKWFLLISSNSEPITRIIFLRIVMLIISALFVWQFYVTIKEWLGQETAVYSTCFVLMSPTIAYYSTEFRSYIFTMLLTIIQVRYFNRIKDKFGTADKIYIFLSLCMLYSHIMSSLIIFVQILYLVVKKRTLQLWNYVMILALSLPLLVYILLTIPKVSSFWFKNIGMKSVISTLTYMVATPDQPVFYFIALLLYTLIFFVMFKYHKSMTYKAYLMLSYIVIPVILMSIISQFYPFYHHRYFLFGGMFVYALAGYSMYRLR